MRFDRPLAKAPGLQMHGGKEHGIPEEPPGSVEQPIVRWTPRTAAPPRFLPAQGRRAQAADVRGPEYIHLHAAEPEDTPLLSCGDPVRADRRAQANRNLLIIVWGGGAPGKACARSAPVLPSPRPGHVVRRSKAERGLPPGGKPRR